MSQASTEPQQIAPRRIAFFGGSFDPPHLGHLAIARAAATELRLDKVLFAPVGGQPLKPLGSAVSFEHRVAMTRLAIADEPTFELSLADAPQPSGTPNFTFETLATLRSQLGTTDSLFCLIGADSFLALPHWHRAAEIPFLAPLIVASRPGEQLDDLTAAMPPGLALEPAPAIAAEKGLQSYLLRNSTGESAPLYLLPGLHVEISASQIRSQIHEGLRGDKLLSTAVSNYIRAHQLYL